MKIKEIYELAIEMGINADPRGREAVEKVLAKARQKYEKRKDKPEEEKGYFDEESLRNPYADSRILYGEPSLEIKKIMVGVDLETPEVLLADRLNSKGAGIDLLLAHHPEGVALTSLADVMSLQEGYMAAWGVRPNLAQAVMEERIDQVRRSLSVGNHQRAVEAARLLDIPLICVHTPTDNLVNDFLTKLIAEKEPEEAGDLLDLIKEIPEYALAAEANNPPRLVAGKKERKVGKVYVDFTGGTSGPDGQYEKLAESGISTVVDMYAGEKQIKAAKEKHLNLISAGHMASDSLGINLLLDAIEEKGVEIVAVSGIIRVCRR
ncbi:MAG: Nif3-like dinuclear metal center hexameric protein [Clostridiales bacterium]|jgi:putative NIF3 family GTP cyclohydrolase 1 type 2|nr:Nif3-like dinuclear metal center hexameric protein [Clostridiales bacterium]